MGVAQVLPVCSCSANPATLLRSSEDRDREPHAYGGIGSLLARSRGVKASTPSAEVLLRQLPRRLTLRLFAAERHPSSAAECPATSPRSQPHPSTRPPPFATTAFHPSRKTDATQ